MPAQPRTLRALKIAVGVMAVLIVGGTVLLIGVIITRIYASSTAPSMTASQPAILPPITLPPGSHIAGIVGAGGAIAVWVTGPNGDRVLLLNPATGAVTLAITSPK